MGKEKNLAEGRRWFDQAAADVRAADTSIRGGNFEWACFQAQQAAKKALRALWLASGLDPRGHSVLRLIDDYPNPVVRATRLAVLRSAAKALDKLYIPTRYPDGLPELSPFEVYTDVEARDAIAAARSVLGTCEPLLQAAAASDVEP